MTTRMKTLPFYLLLIMTLGLAGSEKLFSGQTPDWFLKQFTGTLLDIFPGSLPVAFYLIATFEMTTGIILILGLVRNHKLLLSIGVALAQTTFLMLGFGQRITHQYEAAASLFFYAILTFIAGALASRES